MGLPPAATAAAQCVVAGRARWGTDACRFTDWIADRRFQGTSTCLSFRRLADLPNRWSIKAQCKDLQSFVCQVTTLTDGAWRALQGVGRGRGRGRRLATT